MKILNCLAKVIGTVSRIIVSGCMIIGTFFMNIIGALIAAICK